MEKTTKNLKKITDFVTTKNSNTNPERVCQEIFAEFTKFFESIKRDILSKSLLPEYSHFTIKNKNKKQEYKIELQFAEDLASLYINDLFVETFSVLGMVIDKEIEDATDIKIDLISLKNKTEKLIIQSGIISKK